MVWLKFCRCREGMKRFLILDQALARKIEQQNLANAAQ